jgi:hypothetical protein
MTLDETLQEGLGLLAAAVTDRRSPFRTLVLATVDADGAPSARILVLRAFDPKANRISLHTDRRSAKQAELLANPAAAVLAWDPTRRLQVRLRGRATLHRDDDVARAEWADLPAGARRLYRERRMPGSALADPSPRPEDELSEPQGFGQFLVIRVVFDRMETLSLTDGGQIRAGFDFSAAGVAASWLVP